VTHETGDVRQVLGRLAPGRVNASSGCKAAGEKTSWQEFDDWLGDITAILDAHALVGSTHLHMLRWKIRALTAQPSEVERLKAELANAHAQMAHWQSAAGDATRQLEAYIELEGRLCPEDVGFEEFIGVLRKKIAKHEAYFEGTENAVERLRLERQLTAHPAPSGWQQRIAAITHPWEYYGAYDDQRCFFCGKDKDIAEHDEGGHEPDCLWQNAVDALSPEPKPCLCGDAPRDIDCIAKATDGVLNAGFYCRRRGIEAASGCTCDYAGRLKDTSLPENFVRHANWCGVIPMPEERGACYGCDYGDVGIVRVGNLPPRCGKCNSLHVVTDRGYDYRKAEPDAKDAIPPQHDDFGAFLKSLESGLTLIQAFMGDGRHAHTCNGDEDGPCDCGYVDPEDVVEAMLMDVSSRKDAIPPGPKGATAKPPPDVIVQERERVLALIDSHVAKYLNAGEQVRFQEVVDWIKDDARASRPLETR
jgi:hypothetical protein